jgi:hypothetical protein
MMKKKLVLISLFILPIGVYVFFALASHNSLFLPTITESIPEFPHGQTLKGDTLKLEDKITILGFVGADFKVQEGNFFNLNQKIYNKFKDFQDFQLVMVAPKGLEVEAEVYLEELSRIADINRWNFLFLDKETIFDYFNSLGVLTDLNTDAGSTQVFIVDKERKIRGRKGKNKKGVEEYLESYNMVSAAALHNEMTDDFKIVLREYRLALKKNSSRKNTITYEK